MSSLHDVLKVLSDEEILTYIEMNPKSVLEPNPYQNLPLHAAVGSLQKSVRIVHKLLEIYPEALQYSNECGRISTTYCLSYPLSW
jgi:hypothetical protein